MPLLPEEKARIVRAARAWAEGRRFLCPADLVTWLPDLVASFPRPERPDPATDLEVGTAATLAACNPSAREEPSDEVLRTVARDARLSPAFDQLRSLAHQEACPDLQRAVERAVVHGALLPASGPRDWQHRWPGAWDALFHLIRRHLTAPLEWIAARILRPEPSPPRRWTRQEADATAALIRGALVLGCGCWERWQDFHLASEAQAQRRCEECHRLPVWDGEEPLDQFLFRATLHGAILHLADPRQGTGECAQINGARHGMLVKSAADASLMAGPVLRCAEDPCSGEVQWEDDRCDAPARHPSHVENPTWWLWRKGERTAALCWRCVRAEDARTPRHGCNCLFFRRGSSCPRCDRREWSTRPLQVWVPVQTEPLREHDASLPAFNLQDEVRRVLERWPEGPQRRLAELIFLEGGSLEAAAQELKLEARSPRFRQLVAQVREALARELADPALPEASADRERS